VNPKRDVFFRTEAGAEVPAITSAQMREVDRVAVEVFQLGLLQMMENAGRELAGEAREMLAGASGPVLVLAGGGGNGGGGLSAARHLHNHGVAVQLLLDREPRELEGAVAQQYHILQMAGIEAANPGRAESVLEDSALVIDALIGYSLRGAPRGRAAELIRLCNRQASHVLALDVPSGVEATTGETPGVAIQPTQILTLALPKTGLAAIRGELILADIGIPPELYTDALGIAVPPLFGPRHRVRLIPAKGSAVDA
jgi:NAD(P)H-hydrate epimerase